MEDASIAPEILCILKQVPLMNWDPDRDALGDGLFITLALVTVMVGMQYSINLGYADLAKEIQNMSRPKINK
jgi:hypothetical protein